MLNRKEEKSKHDAERGTREGQLMMNDGSSHLSSTALMVTVSQTHKSQQIHPKQFQPSDVIMI